MEYFRQSYIADVATVTDSQLKELIDTFYSEHADNSSDNLCTEMKQKAKQNAAIAVQLLENSDDKQK
jgi:hypothetical protein